MQEQNENSKIPVGEKTVGHHDHGTSSHLRHISIVINTQVFTKTYKTLHVDSFTLI